MRLFAIAGIALSCGLLQGGAATRAEKAACTDVELLTGTRSNRTVFGRRMGTLMKCGGVWLCGVLALETGEGTGNYKHPTPVVHGLWPQTGKHGTSMCEAPKESDENPTTLCPCYESLSFMTHEWTTHGICAGVKNERDYFDQVCSLSAGPLAVMAEARSEGLGLADVKLAGYKAKLQDSGYPFLLDALGLTSVTLSACAGPDGIWKLARVDKFGEVCGGWGPLPVLAPPPILKCGWKKKNGKYTYTGPPCTSDEDCTNLEGCVRCAKSGTCAMAKSG